MQQVPGAGGKRQQRVVAAHLGVAKRGPLLVGPVDLADGRVDVDGQRGRAFTRAGLPGPLQRLAADGVQLAGMAERERAQERADRGGSEHPVAEHLAGGPGPQPVAVIDPLATGQGRVEQRHRLVGDVGPSGRFPQLDVSAQQLPQAQPDRQRGRKD
jgi:hypothetical protein